MVPKVRVNTKCFGFFDTARRRSILPAAQIRTSPASIMGVRRQDMDTSFVKHPISPSLGVSAKDSRERP
jgi:hypothetical protein